MTIPYGNPVVSPSPEIETARVVVSTQCSSMRPIARPSQPPTGHVGTVRDILQPRPCVTARLNGFGLPGLAPRSRMVGTVC